MNKWTRRFEMNGSSARSNEAAGTSHAHHYFAFLSYSHADSAEADWLHEELEQFRVPSSLVGKLTAHGVIPKRLSPIFRDRHELAAGKDLTEEIQTALSASRCLVVLCSPAAAKSKWTNAEIEYFKRVHPDGCVIAAIIAGDPLNGGEQNCFPAALTQKFDRLGRPTGRRAEPLAADLREQRDARRVGLLKIIAGILGLGLDDLVQRDQLRRHRRLAAITGGSLVGFVGASILAVTAIQARDEARDQRRQAEGLVGFMLGDLKDKLEPLGRLDVLDSVGARALAYYKNQDTSKLSDESLAQRSKALNLLGQVASTRGNLDSALQFYRAAFAETAEALRRSPNDPQRIFDHAQNVFYLADVAHSRGQLSESEANLREYKRLANRLIEIDASNPKWQMEGIYADSSLGVLLDERGRFAEAAAIFENAMADRNRLAAGDPSNPQYKKAVLEGLAWLSTARQDQGRIEDALDARQKQIALLEPLIADPAADAEYQRLAAVAYLSAGRLSGWRGDTATAIDMFHKSLSISQRLTVAEPANTTTAARTAWAELELGRVELASGALNEASGAVRTGCDIADRLVAKDPTVVEWRLNMRGSCLELQTRLALSRGDSVSASEDARHLIAIASDEVARTHLPSARFTQSQAYFIEGLAARSSNDPSQAAAAFNQAAAAWPKGAPERPTDVARKALLLRALGKDSDAESVSKQLAAMNFRDGIFLHDWRSLN